MKRNTLYSFLCGWGLAFALGLGGVLCMVTGLGLSAEFLPLTAGCALGALLAAGFLSLRRGELLLSGAAMAYTLFAVFSQSFQDQLLAMCFRIMDLYRKGYGISIPPQIEGCTSDSHLLPLLFIAGIVMAITAWTVTRRITAIPAVALAILPLASCLILTDTVPDAFPVFLLMLGLILLILTQNVRRQNTAGGNRLTAALSLPVAAALAALFFLVPSNGYEPPVQLSSMEELFSWISTKLPALDTTSDGDWVISYGAAVRSQVNLASLGHRNERQTPVMEINTDYAGTLYLRGQDFDVYTGLSWNTTADRTEPAYGVPSMVWRMPTHHITVKALGRHSLFYIPCYPTETQSLTGGLLSNPGNVDSYSYNFCSIRSDWERIWETGSLGSFEEHLDPYYLTLPVETQQRAGALLYQIGHTNMRGTVIERAEAIAKYVEASASYDTHTSRMPGDETDFALWFLESSDTGYCVHFATAATVLLRAAGIPARYVEGYTIHAEPGENTMVRQKHAHAWVEYYVPYIGWVILDPTPEANQPPVENTTAPIEPTETIPTKPVETMPTEPVETVPTKPSEETLPPVTTTPEVPAAPDPTAPAPPDPVPAPPPRWFTGLLTVIFIFSAVSFLLVGQWYLRRRLTMKRMTTGSTNAQAVARYKEALLLSMLSRLPIPDKLEELVQKALFSQHKLTAEELKQFDRFLHRCTEALIQQPWYHRLIHRLLFAAY